MPERTVRSTESTKGDQAGHVSKEWSFFGRLAWRGASPGSELLQRTAGAERGERFTQKGDADWRRPFACCLLREASSVVYFIICRST